MKPLILTVFIFLFIQPLKSQDTLILQPGPEDGCDAVIHDMMFDKNYGDYDLFNAVTWTASGTPFTIRSLIRFDLSVIPEGAEILDARLDLYYATNHSNGGYYQTSDNEARLIRITEPWDEHQVTWETRPDIDPDDFVILPESTEDYQNYEGIDLTQFVRFFYENPSENYGFIIRLINEFAYTCMTFASSDNNDLEKRPRLSIVYCLPPEVTFDYTIDNLHSQFHSIADTSGIIEWWWDFGDGFFSNIEDPLHVFNDYGTYYVCLKASNDCSDSEYCDSVNIVNTSALPEYNTRDLIVYPNPSDGIFALTSKEDLIVYEGVLIISNLQGKIIRKKAISGNFKEKMIIDLSDCPAGLLFIRIVDENLTYFSKILKK